MFVLSLLPSLPIRCHTLGFVHCSCDFGSLLSAWACYRSLGPLPLPVLKCILGSAVVAGVPLLLVGISSEVLAALCPCSVALASMRISSPPFFPPSLRQSKLPPGEPWRQLLLLVSRRAWRWGEVLVRLHHLLDRLGIVQSLQECCRSRYRSYCGHCSHRSVRRSCRSCCCFFHGRRALFLLRWRC